MNLDRLERLMVRRRLLVLALLCLLGLSLRLADLGEESLWLDEATAVNRAAGDMSGILDTRSYDPNPPLYYVILHGWVRVLGTSEWATRLLSVVFGVLLIPVVYLVASALLGEEVGMMSALLVSLSRFQIAYAQEARMYSLLSLLVLLSIHHFLRILKEPARRDMALYVVFTSAMVYTHVYALFVVAFQNLWMLLAWRERSLWRRWIALQAAVLLAYLPWLPSFIYHVLRPETQGWIQRPTLATLFDAFATYLSGAEWKIVLFAGLMVLGAFTFRKLAGSWSPTRPVESLSGLTWEARLTDPTVHFFLALWISCAALVPFAISVAITPILLTRYAIAASFPLAILLAASIRSFESKQYALAVAVLLAAVSLQPLPSYYGDDQKEQWKEVVALLDERAKPGEPILVNPPSWIEPLLYYCDEGRSPAYPFSERDVKLPWVNRTVMTPENLPSILSPGDGFWTIVVYSGGSYPAEFLLEHAGQDARYAFTEINLIHYVLKSHSS